MYLPHPWVLGWLSMQSYTLYYTYYSTPLFPRSQLDLESHELKYKRRLGTRRLKKIDIVSLNQATRFMDPKTEEEYQEYCNRLKKLVQHELHYKVT